MYLKHSLQQVIIKIKNHKIIFDYDYDYDYNYFYFISKDDKPLPIFAIYSSINVFLMTLQGFFCSLLYCFLNVEVNITCF